MRLSRILPSLTLAIAGLAVTVAPGIAAAETLSAEEAVRRAAAQNPGLKGAILDTQAARQAVEAEEGARDPVFSASITGNYTESAGTTAAGDSVMTNEKGLAAKAALRYTTDVGTQLEVGTSGDASWRSGASPSLTNEPTYTALAYLSARQPLLRGAGTDANLAPQVQAEAAATAAELEERATASATALEVLNAYWELWYADEALGVQEAALETATKQLADARARQEELGTASKVDVLQFQSNLASIKDALSQAETNRSSRAIELGRVLGMQPSAARSLDASGDLPAFGALRGADDLVRRAEERSHELAALRANLDASRSRVSSAEDADQVRLDLFTTVSAGMIWADRDTTGVGLLGGRPAFSVVGGIELELPVGGGRASADAARARTQLEAAETRYQERALAITSEVGTLHGSVAAARAQVDLAAETARVAAELAEAERQRLILGTTTSSEVVKAEQSLREAELRRLRAEVNAVTTRYRLENATGDLISRFGDVLRRRAS